ncbi:WD40 repeat-like protein [Xylona heveae TC161]|uniref:WD40 repeat-like protein n=1 Tax=Xylona heveae (strain CBS 132557 / TC161) TaxID=1328760 RepID=A0A165FR42_XYLHT|nr:WD40 repeat-like protein [Xylona heveae TC161]KZF21277.1 WD40 repeat-like protein [Xylona heveae TC161]
MYNSHRGMVPNAPNTRLNELLDSIRAEFDNQVGRAGEYEVQITNQMNEMDMVRQKLYQLEQQHAVMKQKYEEDVARLRAELDARGGPVHSSHVAGAPPHTGPAQAPPPAIGHGPSNLFGGIMTGQGGQGGPGLAPPPQELPPQPHPMVGAPPGLPQAGPQPQQPPFPGYPAPSANGYTQPPPPTSSPGPGKGPRPVRGPPGPATPQQAPYPDPRASPQIARPTPPPPPPQPPIGNVGNTLADLDIDRLPPSQKREGTDWFAVFNPRIPRVLDVDLVHTLSHESVVCCVRFSHDGKYVATGCNRSAQIFDVTTGKLVSHLQDDSVDKDGDLYIRSVCFSPDGRYLATGAEDRQIRVWDIQNRTIKHTFTGHEQDIYSLDFARNGRLIASGSGDRTVRLWDLDAGHQLMVLSIEDGVTTVAISPDARYVAAGSLDKSVRVWDATSGYLVERLEGAEGHKDSVYSVAFAPNGRDLVSGSLDKTIKMWELTPPRGMLPGTGPKGGKCVRTFEGHKDFVLSVALTPDGAWVLSGSKDRGVQFWDPRTGNTQLMLQGHKNSVISVAPSPMGNLFATGSGDMRARIWRYVSVPTPRSQFFPPSLV